MSSTPAEDTSDQRPSNDKIPMAGYQWQDTKDQNYKSSFFYPTITSQLQALSFVGSANLGLEAWA